MIDWSEYKMIEDAIKNASNHLAQEKDIDKVNKQLIILTDLFSWLKDNGNFILLKDEVKTLKTKDKHILTYIAQYGIRFQVIIDLQYNKYTNIKIKVLKRLLI